jgi:hypothetical protein
MDAIEVYRNIEALSAEFATERRERQRRRELVPADFARLKDAGFLLTGVPVDHGGIWESVSGSARPICDMLRVLAHGDPSVALVCAMHPAQFLDGDGTSAWSRSEGMGGAAAVDFPESLAPRTAIDEADIGQQNGLRHDLQRHRAGHCKKDFDEPAHRHLPTRVFPERFPSDNASGLNF